MGFMEANDGRGWVRRPLDERRQAAIDCFVRYFGPKAAEPIEYVERDWMAEEFSRGCYGAHFTPGVWTAYGDALRTRSAASTGPAPSARRCGTATWRARSGPARRPPTTSSPPSTEPSTLWTTWAAAPARTIPIATAPRPVRR